MSNTPWDMIFNQLIFDLKLLIEIYSLPNPTYYERFTYSCTYKNVQGALMRLPTCPEFNSLALPDKTHAEFSVHWQNLKELSDTWEPRVEFGMERWPDDKVTVANVLKGIEGAKPVGMTGRLYTGKEAHLAGR